MFKNRSFSIILALLVILILSVGSAAAQGNGPSASPVGTAFTYQGQLKDGSGNPITASCDFQFSLWNAASSGTQVGSTLTKTSVAVSNGLFNVPLDFGGVFTGNALWLQIAVRCPAGSGSYIPLTPLQELTPSPYALYSSAAGNATTVTNGLYSTGSYANPAWLTSLDGSKISGAVASATSFLGALAGDVTGLQGSTLVTKLQGVAVDSTAPTNGQVLQYNGTKWAPTTSSSGVTAVTASAPLFSSGGATPNISFTGILPIANGGTGSATQNFVDLSSIQTIGGNKTFSNTITGSISGNAATVTNGLYSTGAYANPSWLTSLAGTKITGSVANATTVTNGLYSTGSYANPAWLTSLAGIKITGTVANATDADTVDGQHASAFASASHNHWGASWTGSGTGLSLSGGTIGLSGNGSTYGLEGQTDVVGGKGVYGYASPTTGSSDGVFGESNSANGSGVVGKNDGEGWGVFGWATGTTNPGVGGLGPAIGVFGNASNTTGATYGVIGAVVSPDGYAGNFNSSTGNGVTINVPAGKIGLNVVSGLAQVAGNTIWHAGNDGAGSGLDADLLDGLHALSFWNLGGNSGTNPLTNFLGTLDNTALEFRVNNSRALRLEPNATSPNLIGGYSGNSVTAGVHGAFIGGGGSSVSLNRVTDDYSMVGGGANNQAGDNAGTTSDKAYATVGGGYYNTASGSGATVGGGNANTASGEVSTVSGGVYNISSGDLSTIAGGADAYATHYGEMAHANGWFYTFGDAQTSEYVLRNTTTDATKTELFLDGGSQRLTLAPNRTLTFDILIIAHSNTGNSGGYEIKGVIENAGGTTALVGALTGTTLGEDVPAWDVFVEADDTNDALEIKVTGDATTIRWVASVRTVEVGW